MDAEEELMAFAPFELSSWILNRRIAMLLRSTAPQRRIMMLTCATMELVLRRYPVLRQAKWLIFDYDVMCGRPGGGPERRRISFWSRCTAAFPDLRTEVEVFHRLMEIEEESTSGSRPPNSRCLQLGRAVPRTEAPAVVVEFVRGGRVSSGRVTCRGTTVVVVRGGGLFEVVQALVAVYSLFHVRYPREYAAVLTFVRDLMI